MRPTRDDTLMQAAVIWALRGTCSRAGVGCVIAMHGRIMVNGYNGAPTNMAHCIHECTCGYGAPAYSHGFGCGLTTPCTLSVHAEANCIAFAARNGVRVEGAELFTTRAPCLPCAQLIINAGIIRVVFGEDHRDMRGVDLISSTHIEVVKYSHANS